MDAAAQPGPPPVAEPYAPVGTPGRVLFLDWLRLAALFGVFVVHATRPFNDIGAEWHIVDQSQSAALTILAGLLAQWVPTLLFLVSGAAAFYAVARRSRRAHLRERTARLLVPFVTGALLLTPIQLFLEMRHRDIPTSGGLAFVADLGRDIAGQPDIAGPRFFVETGLHLWFIGFLFVFSIAADPFLRWLRRGGHRFVAIAARVAARRGGLLAFAAPLAISRFVLPARGPGRYDWADFVFLFLYFLAGAILFADRRFLEAVRRDRWLLLAVGVAADAAFVAAFAARGLPDGFEEPGTALFFASWALLSVLTWCWTLVVLDLGRSLLDFASRRLERATRAAVAFYVLHQPVMILVAYRVVGWEASVPAKFTAIFALSLLGTAGTVALARRVPVVRRAVGVTPDRTTA